LAGKSFHFVEERGGMMRINPVWSVLLACSACCAAEFTLNDAVLATFKIANSGSTATAYLIRLEPDRRVLVSAAHTFEKMKGDDCKLVMRTPNADGTYTRHEVELKVRADGKPLWHKHSGVDLAMLDFVPPKEFESLGIPLETVADAEELKERVPAGQYVRLLCFPATFEANGAGFPIVRQGVIATFPIAPAAQQKTFMIDYTAFGGDSGGPVFAVLEGTGKLKLVGTVISRQWSDEHVHVSEEEDRIIKHPFGLGTAINSVLLRELFEQNKRNTN
jgi:hypothetical protein